MERRNKDIRVRCPACSTLVQLQRRKQWNSETLNQFTAATTKTLDPPVPAIELNDRPSRQAPSSSESPSLAGQLFGLGRLQPAPSSQEAEEHSTNWEPQSLPSELIAASASSPSWRSYLLWSRHLAGSLRRYQSWPSSWRLRPWQSPSPCEHRAAGRRLSPYSRWRFLFLSSASRTRSGRNTHSIVIPNSIRILRSWLRDEASPSWICLFPRILTGWTPANSDWIETGFTSRSIVCQSAQPRFDICPVRPIANRNAFDDRSFVRQRPAIPRRDRSRRKPSAVSPPSFSPMPAAIAMNARTWPSHRFGPMRRVWAAMSVG